MMDVEPWPQVHTFHMQVYKPHSNKQQITEVMMITAPKGWRRSLTLDPLRRAAMQEESVQTTSHRSHGIVQQYHASVTKFMDINKPGSSVLGMTCHDSQVGHTDTMISALWDPNSQTAAWLPQW